MRLAKWRGKKCAEEAGQEEIRRSRRLIEAGQLGVGNPRGGEAGEDTLSGRRVALMEGRGRCGGCLARENRRNRSVSSHSTRSMVLELDGGAREGRSRDKRGKAEGGCHVVTYRALDDCLCNAL